MKVRAGFVSNSSSCSFLSIGFVLKKDNYPILKIAEIAKGEPLTEEEKKDPWEIFYENCDYNFYLHGEDGMKEGEIGIGKEVFSSSDDDYIEPCKFSINDIKKIGEEIKAKYNFEGDPVLFGGQRMCCIHFYHHQLLSDSTIGIFKSNVTFGCNNK